MITELYCEERARGARVSESTSLAEWVSLSFCRGCLILFCTWLFKCFQKENMTFPRKLSPSD